MKLHSAVSIAQLAVVLHRKLVYAMQNAPISQPSQRRASDVHRS